MPTRKMVKKLKVGSQVMFRNDDRVYVVTSIVNGGKNVWVTHVLAVYYKQTKNIVRIL